MKDQKYSKDNGKFKKGKKKAYNSKKNYDAKEKDLENQDKKAYGNDISWYVNDAQLLNDACNIIFSNGLIKPTKYSGLWNEEADVTLEEPGVMSLFLIPTIGDVLTKPSAYRAGDMWDSAVNMSARAEWAYIRQKNAGAKNYDAPDLMMYHLAMDNIYMFWSWMVRLYGYLRLYSFKNKYYPYGILRGMGIPKAAIEELRANMANLRTYINLYAAQMSSFAVPINLPYVKRHLWLFQNVFTDSSVNKAQVYLYNPSGLFKLEEVSEDPMKLEFCEMPNFSNTEDALTTIKEFGDALLAPVVKSESCVIMSGDILKAYDVSGIYGFESIPEDFSLFPIYDETVLSQIHNATYMIVDTPQSDKTCFIAQDPSIDAGYIYQVITAGSVGRRTVILDSRFENPTPTDVMYATRLTAVANPDNPNYIHCGSELLTGYSIWASSLDEDDCITIGAGANITQYYNPVMRARSVGGESGKWVKAGDVQKFLRAVSVISKFDWFPMFIMSLIDKDSSDQTIYRSLIGDIDNFAIVDARTIAKMHKVALNSEFGLPYALTTLK